MLWVCWKNPKDKLNILTHKKIPKTQLRKSTNGSSIMDESYTFIPPDSQNYDYTKLCTRLHNYICLLYKNDFDVWHQSNQVIQQIQPQKGFARSTQRQLMSLYLVLSTLALLFFHHLYLFFSITFNTHIYYIMSLSFKKMKVFLDNYNPFQPYSCLLLCSIWGNNNKSPNLFSPFSLPVLSWTHPSASCLLVSSDANVIATCVSNL